MLNAATHYQLDYPDLALVLALVRGGTLARAAALLRVDVSTVFRAVRRLESSLGQVLFEKSRAGYLPTSLATTLAQQAERAEQALEAARVGVEQGGEVISGTVRLTCTDSVLQGLLLPALARFMPGYPALTLELSTSNDFANLSRRDADIALRLTRTPRSTWWDGAWGRCPIASAPVPAMHSSTTLRTWPPWPGSPRMTSCPTIPPWLGVASTCLASGPVTGVTACCPRPSWYVPAWAWRRCRIFCWGKAMGCSHWGRHSRGMIRRCGCSHARTAGRCDQW